MTAVEVEAAVARTGFFVVVFAVKGKCRPDKKFGLHSSSSDGEVKMAERNYCAVLEKAGTDQQEIKHGLLLT
jgi:hypothetical protein